jgi:DtxR family transcriptional regulator, Mn-dependent transcriptional regulator
MKKSEEDYIKTILELKTQSLEPFVKVTDIAQTFGYTEQSVYEMIRKLQDLSFVVYTPYKGIELTKEGEAEAIRLVRAHRIWEVFLTESLGYAWQDVHEEAEQLEHASSEDLLDRLYEYLGRPSHCQHGNPIPDPLGRYVIEPLPSLWTASAGDSFVLKRVIDDYQLLAYLQSIGMELGQTIDVVSVDPFQELVHVLHAEEPLILSKKIASMLFGTLT